MKLSANSRSECRALTKVEVLLVIATIVLVVNILLPSTHGTKGRSRRVQCCSNLKQVGLSFLLWASDHADHFPQASTNSAGSLAWANSPQVFRHFQVMSSELATPKVLVCPSDPKRKKAADFVNFSNANVRGESTVDGNCLRGSVPFAIGNPRIGLVSGIGLSS